MGNYTQEEQNFLVFIQALKYSTIGLKTYVDQCMDDLHGRLKRKLVQTRLVAIDAMSHNGATRVQHGNERLRSMYGANHPGIKYSGRISNYGSCRERIMKELKLNFVVYLFAIQG